MTLKHTPGPWTKGDTDYFYGGPAIMAQGSIVAAVSYAGAPCGCSETTTANARLIAAAPDLLAALQGLLSDKYLSDPINNDRMAAARAAVSKATGE
jgi:hypothetical protein